MSRFKCGDRVRCVDAKRSASLVFGTEYTVSRVMDGRICVDGAVSDCDWWYENRFELVTSPQRPVEVHTGGPYVARSEYGRVQRELANERASSGNPNGWPLVPVDPSCIPAGHRAVEVTANTEGRLVSGPKSTIFIHNREPEYPRLIVEPIPAPAPLPRPKFPAWIRAGWWVAMDANKEWFAYDIEPLPDEADRDWYVRCNFTYVSNPTPSMHAIPTNRWREAKWQVE